MQEIVDSLSFDRSDQYVYDLIKKCLLHKPLIKNLLNFKTELLNIFIQSWTSLSFSSYKNTLHHIMHVRLT